MTTETATKEIKESASITPILDRVTPVPPPATVAIESLSSGVRLVIGVVVALVTFAWIGLIIWSPTGSLAEGGLSKKIDSVVSELFSGEASVVTFIWSMFVCPVLALFAVIVVHELGHLVAGLCTGYRLVSMEFGVIAIRPPFRITVQRARRAGADAMTAMVPVHVRNLRWRALVMILGGPLANIGSAFAVFLLDPKLGVFAVLFILLSLIVGGGNLVPFRSRAVLSDGKRILLLLRRDGRGERWLAIVQLAADMRKGVEPRDLRPDLIALAVAICDESPDTTLAHVIAYAAAWDRSTEAETAQLLETALRYSNFAGPALREGIFSDAGVFQARKRKCQQLAREWLEDLPTGYSTPRLRLEAAILEVEDDIEGALNKLDEVEKATLKEPDAAQKKISLKSIQRWRSELLQNSSPGQTS